MRPEEGQVGFGKARAGRGRLLPAMAGLVAILAVAAALAPYLRSRGEIRSVARQAREAVAARRGDEARGLVDRWAALSPQGGEPDYYRALLEVQADRPAEALDAMRKSLARGYPEGPLMVLRAVLLARSGRLDQAEPVLARAFHASAGPRAEVAEGLSRIYLKTFRLAEAIRVLESWMEAAPDDPRPYLRRVEVDERTDAGPAAMIRDYREALRRDPGLIEARLGLAEKLREASLFDEAEREYAALLGRDPRNVAGLVGAGRVAMLKGDVPSATRHFEDALALDPRQKVALREIGMAELNGGQISRACARLKLAVEVDPHDPEVRYSYARALRIAGDATRAAEEAAATDRLKGEHRRMDDLRRSLVQRPDDVDLRCEAAKWLIEHGHEKEGLEWAGLFLR
jgi:predicted Zn-dependent protease